jgi:glycosyltransferase involved in cell wall biosynthesis
MKKILFLVPHPIEDAGCRYRIYQFIPLLENAGYQCCVAPFSSEHLFRSLHSRGRTLTKAFHTAYCSVRRLFRLAYLRQFDFVVIHREVFPFLTPLLEKIVLHFGRNVIFSFDDAVYAGHHDVSVLNHPFLYRFKYGQGVDEVLRRCVHVVAGNRILGEYAQRFNPRVTIIPTVVDCNYYRYQGARTNGARPITVGWMGSRSTVSYIRLIEPALKRIAIAYHDQVQFRFYGSPDYKPNLPACSSLPFSLASEIEDLHSLDIGIMPMPDTEWTRGKCAFKAIQYMATGAVAVASPVGVTKDLIQHDRNGLLASSLDDWFCCLSALIRDAGQRQRLAQHARITIENSYSLQIWALTFVSIFDQYAVQRSDTSNLAKAKETRAHFANNNYIS